MKLFRSLVTIGTSLSILVACLPDPITLPQPLETLPELTKNLTKPSATAILPKVNPTPISFPLSEKGPYQVGTNKFAFHDANREDRYVGITIWYPAQKPADSTGKGPNFKADPVISDAPYPLILSSTKTANIYAPFLVSHGFTWASVDGIDTYPKMNEQMIDQPLDILFTLNQVASSPLEDLEGIIDTEKVGVIGYSFDGYNTLAVSGARIDPDYYLAQCPIPDLITEQLVHSGYTAFDCGPALAWDQFTGKIGDPISDSEDGLWQPITDERIRAVMPMAGEGWWLFGEKGLASVNRPVLIIAGTSDELYPENVLIYNHLGTPDKAMISFIGDGHMVMVFDSAHISRIAHFATAFFGYYLDGREDHAKYFSEDFVAQFDDLTWGIYGDK